jgi:hypothetical protein
LRAQSGQNKITSRVVVVVEGLVVVVVGRLVVVVVIGWLEFDAKSSDCNNEIKFTTWNTSGQPV